MTIIESLKYATTGDLPPGKMPVFIHDHRLANRTRVDASVKLKFKDIRGRSCVVTRRMNARAEGLKAKLTTKSEEATIAIEADPGNWKSLSSKVIDVRKEILNLLGVPAAILEYVVFCHQEESTWPLDEPKKLKERFDEIFQVTSYVKSIDALKKIQKENQQELRMLEATLPHLVKQQENKLKLQNDLNELQLTIEENELEIKEGEANIKKFRVEWDEAKNNVSNAEEAYRESRNLEKEICLVKEQVDALAVPDYQGTISDLENEIEAYKVAISGNAEEYARYELGRKSWENRLNVLALEIKQLAAEKEKLQEEIGELKASELMRDKLREEEDDLVKELSLKFLVTEDNVEKALCEILLDIKAELDALQLSNKEKQLSCQKDVDDSKAELAVMENKIKTKLTNCSELEFEIQRMSRELVETETCVEQSRNLKKQIENAEQELQKLCLDGNALQENIQLKEERDNITLKISHLKEECRKSEAAESIIIALNGKKKEALDLKAHLQSLMKKHKTAIDDVFNKREPDFPLKSHISVVLKKVGKAVAHAEEVARKLEKETNKLLSDVEHFAERMEQISDDIESYKGRIEKVVPFGDSVETKLAEVNSLLNKSRNELGLINGCRYLYEKWETEAKQGMYCPLCERKYKTAEETNELITKVSRKRSELPGEIRKLQRKVTEHEELQKELTEVAPFATLLKDLQNKKSDLEDEFQNAQKKATDVEKDAKKSIQEKELLLEKQVLISSVQADASLMDNIWETHRTVQKEVSKLSADLEDEDQHRPSSELRKEMDDLESRYNEVVTQLDALQIKVNEKNMAAERLNNLRGEYLNISEKALHLETLLKNLDEKKREKESQMKDVTVLKGRRPAIAEKLKERMDARSKLVEEIQMEESRVLNRVNELERSLEKLTIIRGKIERTQDNSKSLAAKQNRLTCLSKELNEKNEESRGLNAKLDNVNSQQERGRRLEDQLRKMNLNERIVRLSKQKEEALWKSKAVNDLRKILHQAEKQYSDLTRSVERRRGELEQKKVQFTEMKKLNSKEFVKSEEEYKRTVITKCVTEKVIEDLALYIRVLDDSVVKFHTEKMEEINEVLAQLWDQVYRGNDIETIQIKSESVDETEKRKSYNYRVVMTVDGSEIDMPGRCSAGQKMLASILIRIALSDVFCDKCSIIALDEPTTNLDVLKVENLGDMLAHLIEARCNLNKKNFQLIVITHDDRFVEHLRQLCRPEWVYALSKDTAGLSKVKRHRSLQEAGQH